MSGSHEDASEKQDSTKYTVVARRYRPKTFEDLVGQDTAAQALLRAIETHRVGHAYLFTGARGVGKTSTARIFAKALNASPEGNGRFDPSSEIALAIDSGEDMDVIEIDGASNRGIDEIRSLRQNALVRPSRAPYKIYIIDEVHMLTTAAFNALLKTLEEPPGHVKFIFCTTDPEKIPITVLSRCQRFDFPPVHTDQILGRLQFICQNEGTQADADALKLIARRASGSMRDSQSLLEQLLSFGGKQISVADVHAMLGTADESRLATFAQCMVERNAAGAIEALEAAVLEGVDAGQLAEQFLGYLRDIMALKVGASPDLIRTANAANSDQLRGFGQSWGLTTLLTAIQIVDETIVKMKHSVQSRILLEVALVQICNLVDLQALSEVVNGIARNLSPNIPSPRPVIAAPSVSSVAASVPSDDSKKKELTQPVSQASRVSEQSLTPSVSLDPKQMQVESDDDESIQIPFPEPDVKPVQSESVAKVQPLAGSTVAGTTHQSAVVQTIESSAVDSPAVDSGEVIEGLSPKEQLAQAALSLGGLMRQLGALALEVHERAPGAWQVKLAKEAAMAIQQLRKPETLQRLKGALATQTGSDIHLDFVLTDVPMPIAAGMQAQAFTAAMDPTRPSVSQAQRIREAMAKPLIKRFMEVFEAEVLRVDAPAPTPVSPSQIHEAASVERLESGEGGDSTGSSDTGG
jgi:DNA polymerase-3 subunit gamma/tau